VTTDLLYRELHQRLLAFVRRRVPSDPDAEDILQDVFSRVHENLHRVTDSDRLTAWVYRITRNAIADYHRSRATLAGAVGRLSTEADAEPPHSEQRPQLPGVDPQGELAHCMEPLVSRLPADYGEAVRLADLEGMPQNEAAARVGLSVSGMKSRVQRGRDKLKDLLLDCCHVELDGRRGVIDYQHRGDGGCECGIAAGGGPPVRGRLGRD